MAIKTKDGQFRCMYCEKVFDKEDKADECREAHDIKYLPVSKEDLNKLANFILHPHTKLISDVYGRPIPVVKMILKMIPGNRSLR